MGKAIKCDATVSLLKHLSTYFSFLCARSHYKAAALLWFQVFWVEPIGDLMVVVAACSFCNECKESAIIPVQAAFCHPAASQYLWVILSLWTLTPTSLAVATGPLRCSSWFRGMSQVAHQEVKCASEVNKSRVYERPVTTCFMQAGWLNHRLCGTYGATGHSEINTLWIIPAASHTVRRCMGVSVKLYIVTFLSLWLHEGLWTKKMLFAPVSDL